MATVILPSTTATVSYDQYYSKNWPAVPFHHGEVSIQKQAGVHERVMSYAPRVIRPYMPDQHREFYQHQPFLVAAARDNQGRLWATLIQKVTPPAASSLDEQDKSFDGNSALFVTSPDPVTLLFYAKSLVHESDALHEALRESDDIGLLGIEFATARRNRVNGRWTRVDRQAGCWEFTVDQAFGNCPQYIHPRTWWWTASEEIDAPSSTEREWPLTEKARVGKIGLSEHQVLSQRDMDIVRQADTIFVATGYRGEGDDPRYGNDASHRGGPPGFVQVIDDHTLVLPEFSGNNHFNSIGNLVMDSRMGITVPDFERGGLLQLTGTTEIDMDTEKAASAYPGALRLLTFTVTGVNYVPAGSLPVRWKPPSGTEEDERTVMVTQVVQESAQVRSFHLRPLPQDSQRLWNYSAGQHLPITVTTNKDEVLERTYSLSAPPNQAEYRISVKREPFGKVSSFLHDNIKPGDQLKIRKPAGDFVRQSRADSKEDPKVTVLLSAGIGVTPLLSMFYEFVQEQEEACQKKKGDCVIADKLIWIHGARNGSNHPFRSEVNALAETMGSEVVKTHVVYSQPNETSDNPSWFDAKGHVDGSTLRALVPTESFLTAHYYLCGPSSFVAGLESELQALGVDSRNISSETF